VLQVRSFTEAVTGATSFSEFVIGEIAGHLLRFGIDSFVNGLLALLWPFFVIEHLHGLGIALLIGAFFVFERWLKPSVVQWLPELRRRRKRRSRRRQAKGDSEHQDQGAH
jgi:hypothetical protein